jgi:hypothetical protein
MAWEKTIGIGFVILVIVIIVKLIIDRKKSAVYIDDDFQYDFSDNYNNFYKVVEHRNQKILLRIPDEVSDWENLTRWQKGKQIDRCKEKVKKGTMERIEVSSAVIYRAKSKKLKDFVVYENKLKNTNW